ncbi:amidohydrolase family protein [Ramlibacter sp.]
MLICTDYPHPQARKQIDKESGRNYPALTPEAREKILGGNATKLFNLR